MSIDVLKTRVQDQEARAVGMAARTLGCTSTSLSTRAFQLSPMNANQTLPLHTVSRAYVRKGRKWNKPTELLCNRAGQFFLASEGQQNPERVSLKQALAWFYEVQTSDRIDGSADSPAPLLRAVLNQLPEAA